MDVTIFHKHILKRRTNIENKSKHTEINIFRKPLEISVTKNKKQTERKIVTPAENQTAEI